MKVEIPFFITVHLKGSRSGAAPTLRIAEFKGDIPLKFQPQEEHIMKKKKLLQMIAAGILVLGLSSPVIAVKSIEDIKGHEIRNQQGQQMGTIEQVMIDPNGEIEAVIIEKGGFLGLGEKQQKISWNDIKQAQDGNYFLYSPGAGMAEQQASAGSASDEQQTSQVKQEKSRLEPNKSQTLTEQDQKSQRSNQDVAQQGRQQNKEGRVMVQQPGAQVKVDQSDPQVQVDQSRPKVSVNQPPPKVRVEQPAPQVTVQVKQPKPKVDVQQQQPDVNVQQQEPKVSIQQEKPEISVKQQKPEVVVQKAEPNVQVDKTGKAEVFVQEQKQAQVEIERQGKPQVEVVTQQPKDRQKQGSQSQINSVAQFNPERADSLKGRQVVSANGEQLGTVVNTALSQDKNSIHYIIVQGEQDKLHPIPAELVRAGTDQQELKAEVDKKTFINSPSFEKSEEPQLTQQQWSQDINSHYGVSPSWQEGTEKPGPGDKAKGPNQPTGK